MCRKIMDVCVLSLLGTANNKKSVFFFPLPPEQKKRKIVFQTEWNKRKFCDNQEHC